MGSGVFEQFDLVVGAGDNFGVANDDGADRYLVGVVGEAGLAQRFAHEIVVAGEIDFRHLPDATGFVRIRQVNNETGIADISAGRARLRVTGADRVAFLHGQCTNDVKRLRPGESCYAAFLTAKGKMRGDAHIVCLDDAFLLEASRGLLPLLEKFVITDDVTIEDVSTTMNCYLLIGRESLEGHAPSWPRTAAKADATERVPPDLDLPAGAMNFASALGVGVISPTGLDATMSDETLEVLRIEAGIPKFGLDMDENTIPNEAGLEKRAINYEKGCYIGQETIARIKTYGHVNRRLVQLQVQSAEVPKRHERILAGEREVGQVTSAVHSVRLGKPLALGYVRGEFAKAGTELSINQSKAEVLRICGE